MISERTLKRWRREALNAESKRSDLRRLHEGSVPVLLEAYIELNERILRMTQELLDQHLVRK